MATVNLVDVCILDLRHNAAPTVVGTYKVGDRVWNSDPAAGEFIGWVCVAAGTPGTWKGFGAIEA